MDKQLNQGEVIQVIGPVLDVSFHDCENPYQIGDYLMIAADPELNRSAIGLEVMQDNSDGIVRCCPGSDRRFRSRGKGTEYGNLFAGTGGRRNFRSFV